jgi:hypothetical protein
MSSINGKFFCENTISYFLGGVPVQFGPGVPEIG